MSRFGLVSPPLPSFVPAFALKCLAFLCFTVLVTSHTTCTSSPALCSQQTLSFNATTLVCDQQTLCLNITNSEDQQFTRLMSSPLENQQLSQLTFSNPLCNISSLYWNISRPEDFQRPYMVSKISIQPLTALQQVALWTLPKHQQIFTYRRTSPHEYHPDLLFDLDYFEFFFKPHESPRKLTANSFVLPSSCLNDSSIQFPPLLSRFSVFTQPYDVPETITQLSFSWIHYYIAVPMSWTTFCFHTLFTLGFYKATRCFLTSLLMLYRFFLRVNWQKTKRNVFWLHKELNIFLHRLNRGGELEIMENHSRFTTQSKRTKLHPSIHPIAISPTGDYPNNLSHADMKRVLNHHYTVFKAPNYSGDWGNIFHDTHYRGIRLPEFLINIQYDHIPEIFASFKKYTPKFFTRVDADAHQEVLRNISFLESHGANSEFGNQLLKDIIFEMYWQHHSQTNVRFLVPPQATYLVTPEHFQSYKTHALIGMTDFSEELFHPTTTRRGDIREPVFTRTNDLNWFGQYTFDAKLSKNKLFTIQKLKSILKDLISHNKTYEDAKAIISNHCPLWKINDTQPNSLWFLPFLKPEVLYYSFSDPQRFSSQLRMHITNLRQSIFQYSQIYFDNASISHADKKTIRAERIQRFQTYMRSPEIQAKFAVGVSKDVICQEIHDMHSKDLRRAVARLPLFDRKRKLKTLISTKSLRQARDAKQQFNDTFLDENFTTQSNFEYIIGWSTIFSVGITAFCAYLYSKTINARFLYRVAQHAAQEHYNTVYQTICNRFYTDSQNIKSYINVWKDFSIGRLDDISYEYRLYALEIKSIIHCLIYLYSGQRNEALAWASNLLVSRPKIVRDLLFKLDFSAFATYARESLPTFTYNGVIYQTSQEAYARILHVFDTHGDIDAIVQQEAAQHFDTQSGAEFTTLFTGVASLFESYGLKGMTAEDIRVANNQFTYLGHVGRKQERTVAMTMKIISMITRSTYAFDPFDPEYQAYTIGIIDTIIFVDQTVLVQKDLPVRKDLMQLCIDHYNRARSLNINPRMETVPNYLKQMHIISFAKLKKLAEMSTALLESTHQRITPTSVFITGPPEVGKTASMKFYQKSISYVDGEVFSPECSYPYSSDDDYWSGYAKQKFVIMDDVFKSSDVKIRGVESNAIIAMVNTSILPCNMPFESKGQVFFDSQFVFLTTNIANTGIRDVKWQVELTDNKALLRRLHLVLHDEQIFGHGMNVAEKTFRIDQCLGYPDLIGKRITNTNVVKLLLQMRQNQREAHTRQNAADQFDELFGEGTDMNFVTQSDKNDINGNVRFGTFSTPKPVPPTSEEFILKLAQVTTGKIWDPKIIKYMIFIFFLLVFLGTTGAYFISWFTGQDFDPQSHLTGEKMWKQKNTRGQMRKPQPIKIKLNRIVQARKKAVFHTQSDHDNFYTSCAQTLAKSVVRLTMRSETLNASDTCTAFHIRDGYFAAVAHMWLSFNDIDDPTLTVSTEHDNFTIPKPDAIEVESVDLVVFRITGHNLPPPLYKHMQSWSEMSFIEEGTPMKLISRSTVGELSLKSINKGPQCDPFEYISVNQRFSVEQPLCYSNKTFAGESGSPIVVALAQGKPAVIGMHIGMKEQNTRNAYGVATPLCKEYFDQILAEGFTTQSDHQELHPRIPHQIKRRVAPDMQHFPPTKSKITRTPFWGWNGPSTKIPAKLAPFTNSEGLQVDPINLAMRKMHQYNTAPTEIPEQTLDYMKHLYPREMYVQPTWEDALNGDPVAGYQGIVFGTSPGYPFSLGKKRGKGSYVKQDPVTQQYSFEPEFLDHLIKTDNDLQNGIQMEVIWADVLKDEPRPIDKVNLGKTRLFSTCPVDYLLIVRKYTMPFVNYLQQHAADKPIAIGINPHSGQWTRLHDRLARFKDKGSVVAGDFSNYDGKLPKFLTLMFVDFMNWWFDDGPVNASIRHMLFEHIHSAHHICWDCIYQIFDGNPSGNPNTGQLNSFVNCVMTHVILTVDLGLADDEFEMVVYGDDNVITIKQAGLRCSDFTPHYKRRFDMDYTHCSKEENEDYDTLYTVRFLSRLFDNSKPFVKAPLPLETIVQASYWFKTSADPTGVMLSVAESIFTELSQHPKQIFDDVSDAYIKMVKERQPALHSAISNKKKTYATYDRRNYYGTESFQGFVPQSAGLTRLVENFPEENPNTQFTDRAVNEPETSLSVQLGHYQDVHPVSDAQVNNEVYQTIHQTNNMETFDMSQTLEREFKVADILWTTAQANGTILQTINFPTALFAQQFIAQKIADFRYFRAGLELSIRIASTSFVYGKILVEYEPYTLAMANTATLFTRTGSPHVILSASASESCVFRLPFINPNRAIDLGGVTFDEMGRINIVVYDALIDISGAVNSAEVFVTARFTEPQLFLPHDFIVQSSFTKGTEAKKKSAAGLISSSLEIAGHLGAAMKDLPFVGGIASTVSSIAAPSATMFKAMGLSKPTTVNATQIVVVNENFNLATGKGINTAPKIAMDPENAISTAPICGGINQDEMELAYIVGTPQQVQKLSFNSATPPAILMRPYTYNEPNTCFVDSLAQHWKYFSGSFKMRLYITASQMHSIRAVIYLADKVGADWQNCYHRVIDIQGDTEIGMTIPYCNATIIQETSITNDFAVWFQILSWSQANSTATCPISVNVYKAAASDFRLHALVDTAFLPTSNPRSDFNANFDPIHPSIVGYVPENVVCGEEYTTLREVIHRYHAYDNYTIANMLAGQPVWENLHGTTAIGVEMFARFFRFRRGSMRFKFINKDPAVNRNAPFSVIMQGGDYATGVAVKTRTNGTLDAEVPYFHQEAFQPATNMQTSAPYTWQVTGNAEMYMFKSGGDDMSFHFLRAPAPGTVVSPDSTYGQNGFMSWLST